MLDMRIFLLNHGQPFNLIYFATNFAGCLAALKTNIRISFKLVIQDRRLKVRQMIIGSQK